MADLRGRLLPWRQIAGVTLGLAVLLAAVAFSLIRVQVVDVPWHLATARLARAAGHWPVRNTFSYTFPDYPLYPQYPIFQRVILAAYEAGGWSALSLFSCAGWVAGFLLFVRWGGTFRQAAPRALFWLLGLYALQRRMTLRPDLFTMLALGTMLLALDAYSRGRRWAMAAVPLIHLLWVNSHQLFPVSLSVQALYAAHLIVERVARRRWGVDDSDADKPIWPAVAALAASVMLCFATPLGAGVLDVPLRTATSLTQMRNEVLEFRFLWEYPYEVVLALLTGAPAAGMMWRGRRRWAPFDVGIWLMSLLLVLSAVRGLMFFGIISVAVLQRTALRLEASGDGVTRDLRPATTRALRGGAVVMTMLLAANVVYRRWLSPPLMLGGTQPGIGRSLGGWADAAVAFLRANPPPGRMLNMAWTSGNALIWGLPEQPVFVDPRFESYPPAFIRRAADASRDDTLLAGFIDRYQPTWIFAEHFRDAVRARAVTLIHEGWVPVYVDTDHLILVRPGPDTASYRAAHAIDLSTAEPGDLLEGPLALRAQQRARFARLMDALGLEARGDEQRRAIRAEAGQGN